MLVQATTPRPVFDSFRYAPYIYIHTLAKAGVSDGTVILGGTTNPGMGERDARHIEPMGTYPIEGEAGFHGYEYVLPFWDLFKEEYRGRNLKLVPFCTAGFTVTIKSAFRGGPGGYVGRTMGFSIHCPVTGGGILRVMDSPFDLTNSSFDPFATNPKGKLLGTGEPNEPDVDLLVAFNRTHKAGGGGASASALRAARIAEAEASIAKAQMGPGRHPPQLTDGKKP